MQELAVESSPKAARAVESRRVWMHRGAIVLIFFIVDAPTLTWMEFSNAEETVNVATALELKRDGHWQMPTLGGVPRQVKPPLTAWLTAAVIRPSTFRDLSSVDPPTREAAYRSLAWDVRWPMLLAACLVLLCVYEIGRSMDSPMLGLISAVICGTNLLFLRFAGMNETDSVLALWVAVTNLFLAKAVLERKYVIGFLGAGVALGLALMSKGPLAFVQTALPVALFVAWRRWIALPAEANSIDVSDARQRPAPWLVLGILIALIVGFGWYVWMGIAEPKLWETWWREVTRYKANELPPSPWFRYFVSFFFFVPWIVFLIAGLWMSIEDVIRRRPRYEVLALFLFIVPFLVMLPFREKKERYLLPLVAPAALIAGRALVEYLRLGSRGQPLAKIVVVSHWLVVAALALGVPFAGAVGLWDMNAYGGAGWNSAGLSAIGTAVTLVVLWFGLWESRRRRGAMVVTSVLLILLANMIYTWGSSHAPTGRSSMKSDLADDVHYQLPDAEVYCYHHSNQYTAVFSNAAELSLYLNKTVPWVADPAKIPPSTHPQLIYSVFRKRDDAPPTPPGWELIPDTLRQKEVWRLSARNLPTTLPAQAIEKRKPAPPANHDHSNDRQSNPGE